MAEPPPPSGPLAALHTLGDHLVTGLQQRIELFAIELQEEKFRLIRLFLGISAAVFAGMLAVTFASITLVYCFWAEARLAVLIGLTGLYAGLLLLIILALRRFIARQPAPFADTQRELGIDRTCIRKPN